MYRVIYIFILVILYIYPNKYCPEQRTKTTPAGVWWRRVPILTNARARTCWDEPRRVYVRRTLGTPLVKNKYAHTHTYERACRLEENTSRKRLRGTCISYPLQNRRQKIWLLSTLEKNHVERHPTVFAKRIFFLYETHGIYHFYVSIRTNRQNYTGADRAP